MKVCLDTNVLVAAFATRGLCADVVRTVLTEHALVLGEVIVEVLRRVLTDRLKLPQGRLREVESVFATLEIVPRPDAPSDIEVRDQADRWILATAIAGDAGVLVTGDDDLLAIAGEAPISILSPRAFWERLRTGHAG